jgi:hypothetical protein
MTLIIYLELNAQSRCSGGVRASSASHWSQSDVQGNGHCELLWIISLPLLEPLHTKL